MKDLLVVDYGCCSLFALEVYLALFRKGSGGILYEKYNTLNLHTYELYFMVFWSLICVLGSSVCNKSIASQFSKYSTMLAGINMFNFHYIFQNVPSTSKNNINKSLYGKKNQIIFNIYRQNSLSLSPKFIEVICRDYIGNMMMLVWLIFD